MDGDQTSTGQAQPTKPTLVRAFTCPNCGSTVTLLASGFSLVATCSSCRSIIDVNHPELKILSTYTANRKVEPWIPLGTKGTLFGTKFQVVGFMVRTDASGTYPWQEYLLFNPYEGYRWLVQANGHWNFVTMLKEPLLAEDSKVSYEGKSYRVYLRGQADVRYVLGEFYWRVKVGERVACEDYICPPYILSLERSKGEQIWSHGQYLEPSEVKNAFNVDLLPEKEGVSPNQPNPHSRSMGLLCWIFVFALLGIQFFSSVFSSNETVFSSNFIFETASPEKVKVTPTFDIKKNMADLVFDVRAAVDNNWADFDISLIDVATEKSISFDSGVEFYHGYDEGEYWSEGKNNRTVYLSSIPGGKYYLTIEPSVAPGISSLPYSITVRRDVLPWSNFWLLMIALLILPVYSTIRKHGFEMRRWEDSDYSPYPQSTDE